MPTIKSHKDKGRNMTPEELERFDNIADEEIDTSDIPEYGEDFWKDARVEMPRPKKAVTIRLDPEVLAWFKNQGKGYQTRINAVLKAYVKTQKAI